MSADTSKRAGIGVLLKRLVSRLAYCAKHDAKWWARNGLRIYSDDVVFCVKQVCCFYVSAPFVVVFLILRPLFSPITWVWHSLFNANRVEALMRKSANKPELTDAPAKTQINKETQNG